MFTFCVELLTGVEVVWREVGHVWQQSKLWQTCHLSADMKFVQNSQVPDFEAKNFTPQKCVNCDILHRKSA